MEGERITWGSPLAANIYLNEVDWAFDTMRRKTAQKPYEAVNYHASTSKVRLTVPARRVVSPPEVETCATAQ